MLLKIERMFDKAASQQGSQNLFQYVLSPRKTCDILLLYVIYKVTIIMCHTEPEITVITSEIRLKWYLLYAETRTMDGRREPGS
jgi:hypothetical protein